MESIGQIIEVREKKQRRGDGTFVSLLFVVAVPVAAIVFVLTNMFIGNTDEIRAFVPKNAVVYVHINGSAVTEKILASSVQMPTGIHPREMAIIATPGDDGLQWSTIVAWNALRRPTPQEVTALDARGAVHLDDRRFFIGDPTTATAAKLAPALHSSIADDDVKRRALDAAAAKAPIQLFADPAAFILQGNPPALISLLDGGNSLNPIVASVVLRDGSFEAKSVSADSSVTAADATGGAQNARLADELGRIDADVAVSEPSAGFDVALLFSDAQSAGAPLQKTALEKTDALRAALSAPHALWIARDSSAQGYAFLLHFPTVDASAAATSVAHVIAAKNPVLDTLTMPDGETAQEYRANSAQLPQPDHGDRTFNDGQTQIIVGGDGGAGTLITNSAAMLSAYRSHSGRLSDSSCEKGRAKDEVRIKNLDTLVSADSEVHSLFSLIHIQSLTFGLNVDNELFICGKNF